MNDNTLLAGKRLLILGGIIHFLDIVEEAKRMGVETYVADYLPDSPAKKIADHACLVDALDVDAIVRLCREQKIDGITTGPSELLLPYCEKISRRMGFPFWGTEETIRLCTNKYLFKQACERSGLPTTPWQRADKDDYLRVIEAVELPAVIKPVDSSGSRGVVKCHDRAKLREYVEQSLSVSKSGAVLIEKAMDPRKEFSVYYMMDGARCYLTGMGDRYINIIDEEIAPQGKGMLYPSVRLDEWLAQMDGPVQRFLLDNGMKYGFVFLQGFYEQGRFYLHEIGYRLNAGFSYRLVEHFSRYSQLRELIYFALTGEMRSQMLARSDARYDGYGAIVTISVRPGTIAAVSGVEEIEADPNVIHFYQLHSAGDTLAARGTSLQVFAYILCAAKTADGMRRTVAAIRERLQITDGEGHSLLNEILDPDEIDFGGNT